MSEKETRIKLSSQTDVMRFCTAATKHNGEVTLISGKYVVDGKSLMGILSLDLEKPINVIVEDPNIDFAAEISDFIIGGKNEV